MKKAFIPLLAALLLCGMLLAACGGKPADETGATTTALAGIAQTDDKLYAEVADIVGNQLSLKVLNGSFNPDMYTQRTFNLPTDENGEPVTGNFFIGGDGSGGQRIDGAGPQIIQNGELPEGFTFPEGMSRGEPPTDENGEPITRAPRYSGEEKDIIIPIGTPIKSISFSDGELKTKDAEIGDIKNGSTVQILYDGDRIAEVQIINTGMRGMGPNTMGGGPGGEGGPPDFGDLPPGAEVYQFEGDNGVYGYRVRVNDEGQP